MSYIEIVIEPNFEKACEALEKYEMHKDATVALKCLKAMWSKKVTSNELIHMMGHHRYINGRNYYGDHLWGDYVLTLGYYIQASCHVLKPRTKDKLLRTILKRNRFRKKLNLALKKKRKQYIKKYKKYKDVK